MILLPKRNEDDLEDLPDEVRQAIEFVFLDTVDDAIDAALEPAPKPKKKLTKKAAPAKEVKEQ